ncbi:hypothetical protein NDU88_002752 [Pleurodeles waltl]|uniref:Uncharacterized protein n=1 Tax=Pleurodeles waltl TaxID=8319 RepID=A0AAV7UAK5_PLEWA|nr:hypothetical protein NDU88_002752 [Pleurodeles waltl]
MQLLAEGTGLLRGSVGTLRTQGQWTGLRGSAVPALADNPFLLHPDSSFEDTSESFENRLPVLRSHQTWYI